MRTSDESSRRKSRWDPAIQALLLHATREKAAAAAGVDPATLYRWMKNPEFQRVLLEARREVFGLAMGRLQEASHTAVDTLITIMNDAEGPVGSRVQAAKCVLEQSRKSLELDDLKTQVAELESWRAEQEKGREDA